MKTFDVSGRFLIARINEDGKTDVPIEMKPDIVKANDSHFYVMGVPKTVASDELRQLGKNIREMDIADANELDRIDTEIETLEAMREEVLRGSFKHGRRVWATKEIKQWLRQ